MSEKITLSVIKADVGGYVGHSCIHPDLLKTAEDRVFIAREKGLLVDCHVTRCGDDLELIMTHKHGIENEQVHKLAWDTFVACTEVAKGLKLYGAGQDLLQDTFTGTVKGMGPGVAEMEFEERKSDPVIVFMADKTSPGAWNLPLYRIFADPFNTAGLVIDPTMHEGFQFEVIDVFEHRKIMHSAPEELYDLLMFIGAMRRFIIKNVFGRTAL
jgi:fructose 1,6-bisphosphate aldolase/phosphatase